MPTGLSRSCRRLVGAPALRIRVRVATDHPKALDQFTYPIINRVFCAISGRFNAGIGDDVVALVWILADRRFEVNEIGHLGLDALAQLGLGEVGVRKPDIVRAAAHAVEVIDRVQERMRGVANVKIVPLEMRLEQNDETIGYGTVNEVIDQEVDSHPRR